MFETLTVAAATTVIAAILSLVLAFVVNREVLWKGASTKKADTRPLTLRISGIPRNITKNEFRGILTNSTDKMSTTSPTADRPRLLGWSFAPAHSVQSFVATATFGAPPSPRQLESAIHKIIDSNRLRVDLDFFGLTPLADPEADAAVE
jgi:hypothetical protein